VILEGVADRAADEHHRQHAEDVGWMAPVSSSSAIKGIGTSRPVSERMMAMTKAPPITLPNSRTSRENVACDALDHIERQQQQRRLGETGEPAANTARADTEHGDGDKHDQRQRGVGFQMRGGGSMPGISDDQLAVRMNRNSVPINGT